LETVRKACISVTKAADQAKAKAEEEGIVEAYAHIGKRLNNATKTTGKLAAGAWVPPSLKALSAGPENGGTFGTPWLLRSSAAQSRSLCSHIPLWGTGHFICGIEGYAWLVSYPAQCILDLGEVLEKGWEVTSALSKADFQTFFSKNVSHSLVRPGSVHWVPYGHCDTIISLAGNEPCDYIVLPYMAMPLVEAMVPAVRAAVLQTFQRFLHSTMSKHESWTTNGPAFVTWFQAGIECPEKHASDNGEESSD
jgi:hypothetical protein